MNTENRLLQKIAKAAKPILSLCFLCGLLCVSASAQRAGIYTLAATNVVLTATTNSPDISLACSEFSTAGIQISCNSTAAANTVITFRFAKSLDSTTYESTPEFPISVTTSGTNIITVVTNLNIPSAAILKLTAIEAPSTLASNISVKVHFKASQVRTR